MSKRKLIDADVVIALCERGLGWNAIACHESVNVSRETLRKWRIETGFNGLKESIDEAALDVLVANHISNQPRRGEIMIAAYVSHMGFQVSRKDLRNSIHRVDPEGVLERKKKPIHRRMYSVAGPHHLWHQDGNHKLIRWGIVIIHGCIDGCTRNIIYPSAQDNNLSSTVLQLFKLGVERYQLPSRVRGDKGGENVLIAEFMIRQRGVGRASYIAGSATHNTRIERLWRDMRQHTIQSYIELFTSLELEGMDLCNLLHIYILQYLFIPVINEALNLFIAVWNNHKLSTENNRSPQQLLNDLSEFTAEEVETIVIKDIFYS
jgi:hypothetical protein